MSKKDDLTHGKPFCRPFSDYDITIGRSGWFSYSGYLLDYIVDAAGSRGTGKWTMQEAANLGVAVPTITAALDMRYISSNLVLREKMDSVYADSWSSPEVPNSARGQHIGELLLGTVWSGESHRPDIPSGHSCGVSRGHTESVRLRPDIVLRPGHATSPSNLEGKGMGT